MKTICVVTGSRAEYGLLKPLLCEIATVKKWRLKLCVTGSHLSPEFGLTYKQIEQDGFVIDKKIDILLSSGSGEGIAKSMGIATMGFAQAFDELRPDILIVLGDRYEILAVAATALVMKIPVAHINGGDITKGAYDDSIRHAVTKLSRIHFTATETYRKRVIQMGEHPATVFTTGALGLDNIYHSNLLSKEKLEKDLGIRFQRNTFLITYHPETLSPSSAEEQVCTLLQALNEFNDAQFIFTKANADNDGRVINQLIDEYVNKNTGKAVAFTSLGQLRYLSTIQFVQAVIGNSSSGIVEVPYFKVPTVNIGKRQEGRIKGKSIIDCGMKADAIKSAIDLALSMDFRSTLKEVENPYGDGNAAKRIIVILKEVLDNGISLQKEFHDINITYEYN